MARGSRKPRSQRGEVRADVTSSASCATRPSTARSSLATRSASHCRSRAPHRAPQRHAAERASCLQRSQCRAAPRRRARALRHTLRHHVRFTSHSVRLSLPRAQATTTHHIACDARERCTVQRAASRTGASLHAETLQAVQSESSGS